MTNRLDLINRVPEELWTEVCNTLQEVVIKIIPKKKKCKNTKWLSEEALQIAEKKREAKVERFYEDLQDLLEHPKKMSFHYRGLECKSRRSRNTWSNRQIWPWSKNEAGQRLIEFCQENTLIIANTLFQ